MQRLQFGGAAADPAGERRAFDFDAAARENLRLPIQRQMIGIFAHHDIGDETLGRQSAFDQARRGRRLDHAGDVVGTVLLAVPARILRPLGDDHAQLRRDLVEPLGRVLADLVQRAVAARADRALRLDDDFFAWQTRQDFGTRRARFGCAFRLRGARGLRRFGLQDRCRRLQIFERERELSVVDALGLAAEVRAADLGDDRFELGVQLGEPVALRRGFRVRRALGFENGDVSCALRVENRAQRVDIVRQGLGRSRHRAMKR